ncbi:MAG: hypothetical protein AAB606_05125 [Patescibacteria group bacterium]
MTLDEQYQQTIEDQRNYLLAVQSDFNKKCDAAKAKAEEKSKQIPETDKPAKEQVLKEQKVELETALKTLKEEIDHSTRQTMKKLEEIVRQKEQQVLGDLENQLANL